MSKGKENHITAKSPRFWQFPQIFCRLPAIKNLKHSGYQMALVLVFLALGFLLVLNLDADLKQPYYLKRLLQNPEDLAALKTVIANNHQPELDQYLKQLLTKAGVPEAVVTVAAQKQQRATHLKQIEILVKEHPQYPDGHALLAVLYYRQFQCQRAKTAIKQALQLDSNRLAFYKLQQEINRCSP